MVENITIDLSSDTTSDSSSSSSHLAGAQNKSNDEVNTQENNHYYEHNNNEGKEREKEDDSFPFRLFATPLPHELNKSANGNDPRNENNNNEQSKNEFSFINRISIRSPSPSPFPPRPSVSRPWDDYFAGSDGVVRLIGGGRFVVRNGQTRLNDAYVTTREGETETETETAVEMALKARVDAASISGEEVRMMAKTISWVGIKFAISFLFPFLFSFLHYSPSGGEGTSISFPRRIS